MKYSFLVSYKHCAESCGYAYEHTCGDKVHRLYADKSLGDQAWTVKALAKPLITIIDDENGFVIKFKNRKAVRLDYTEMTYLSILADRIGKRTNQDYKIYRLVEDE